MLTAPGCSISNTSNKNSTTAPDTLDGRLIHRRVDQEKGNMPAPEALDSMPKLHARSVMVGSDTLGAVARIDLIESDDGRVVPVDYKRGAPPDVPERAYQPERVQVCLQGYSCASMVMPAIMASCISLPHRRE